MATAAKQQTSSPVCGSKSPKTIKAPSPSKVNSSITSSTTTTTSLGQSVTFLDTDEDIATIAKQISDHAEAIYQTWKARGLAPTEILNCHTSTIDTFGKTLTPSPRNSIESPVAELLANTPNMSNNNLERLVNSFVNEDKARQQAAKKQASPNSSILTSGTIKDALKKFENNQTTSGYVKPNFLIRNTNVKTSTPTTNQLNKNVPDVLMDTINHTKQKLDFNDKRNSTITSSNTTSLKKSQNSSDEIDSTIAKNCSNSTNTNNISNQQQTIKSGVRKPKTPAKPANLTNHTPSWPLKNRLGIGNANIQSSLAISTNTNKIKTNNTNDTTTTLNKMTMKSIEVIKKSADLLDEVSREEERLINALKTGIVLNNNINSNNDNKIPEVITSPLKEKPESDWINKESSIINTNKSLRISPTMSSTVAATNTNSTTSIVENSNHSGIDVLKWNDDPTRSITLSSPINSSINKTLNSIKEINTNQINTDTTITMFPAATSGITVSSNAPVAPGKYKIRPKNDAAVPHPESKQNSNNTNNSHVNNRSNNNINPVRPFLTRGSVAERVLMFEKCPDVKVPLRTIKREPPKITTKPLAKPTEQTHTTLQRHIRSSSKNVYIPRFHFPHGKPSANVTTETTLQRLVSEFDSFPNNQVPKEDLHRILKICGFPLYWRMPIIACTQNPSSGLVDGPRFIEFWKQMSVYCHDAASRFVYILSRGQRSRCHIIHEDLTSLVQDVVDNHPGLAFLKEASEFHSRYVHTVIARIFYSVNRCWSGKITVPELRRSNLLQVIQLLEEEEDINQIMAYFSYEHFYVIYCKFWELDRDHDLYIDQNDLARHNDHALSTRIIERIFSGCVTRCGKSRILGPTGPKMSYTDFVWFLLSEEDKTHPTSIEYWFRCMDLDGDGIISMYELEYFYEEQQQRMESIGIETLPFEDCLCQMLDMIKPLKPGCITLSDLKRCRMTPIFFDTFFNLEKYLEHEQRDPFATQRDNDEMTDWDRYAAQEYELLVAEEGGDTHGSYDEDEDYESNIDILESQLDDMSNIISEW